MRQRIVLVVAVTALAVTGAPGATAAPNDVWGSTVLQGLSWAGDINNHDAVVGSSGSAPARWEPTGRTTLLPVPSGASWAGAGTITDSGFVIGGGDRDDGEGGFLGFALLWDPQGRLVDTQVLPGSRQTHAADVNESGTMVGTATDADGAQHAVRWDSQGRITELRTLPDGTFSAAVAINNQGAAVGYSDVVISGTHVTHAVFWDAAGRIMDLGGPFSTTASQAVDINNAGVIVGSQGVHTVRWNRLRRITLLQPPPNFTSSWPLEMNDDGVILGHGHTTEMMVEHPIRWDRQGQVTDLGGGSWHHTWASAMNSSGTVVGTSDNGWHMPGVPRYSTAQQWDPAGTVSALAGLAGGWNTATGINDRGVVCGVSGNNSGSDMHGVLWNRWQSPHPTR